MKYKILFLGLAFCFGISAAFSQGLHLGIKAGADMHKLEGKSFKDEFSYGYHLGAYAQIGLGNKFAIQPEVLFSQVNIDTSSNFSSIYNLNNIDNVNLQYLKIPILLNFKPNPFVTLQLGPQYGILLDKTKNLLINGKQAFSNGDFSLVGGLQVNIAKFKIYGRYGVGLSNINDIDNQDKWKNQNIQLGIGFNIF